MNSLVLLILNVFVLNEVFSRIGSNDKTNKTQLFQRISQKVLTKDSNRYKRDETENPNYDYIIF